MASFARLCLLFLLLSPALGTLADGLVLESGHLNAGPYITLQLSKDQILTVKTKRVVVLDSFQKTLLSTKAHVAPTVLTVYSMKAAKNGIDICYEYNLALWVSEDTVEVPIKYLVSDEVAIKKADQYDSID